MKTSVRWAAKWRDDKIEAQAAEIARLRAALESIANNKYCDYYEAAKTDSDRMYTTGIADGHRFAAQIAREALTPKDVK